MTLFSENMTLFAKTKITELERTSTFQRSITSENWDKRW